MFQARWQHRYTAVGVYVLGRTLKEAWGAQAGQKQREFNAYLKVCFYVVTHTSVIRDVLSMVSVWSNLCGNALPLAWP